MTRVPHVLNFNCKLFITLDQDKTTPHINSFILWWSGSLDTSTIFALLFQKIVSLLLDCKQNRLLVCWIWCSSTAPQSPQSSSSWRTRGRWCCRRPGCCCASRLGAFFSSSWFWIINPTCMNPLPTIESLQRWQKKHSLCQAKVSNATNLVLPRPPLPGLDYCCRYLLSFVLGSNPKECLLVLQQLPKLE